MKKVKSYLLVFWLLSIVLKTNAQCDIYPSKSKGCVGDVFTFLIMAPAFSYASVTWKFGDGDSSNQNTSTINHLYHQAGAFTVTITLRDGSGAIKCGPNSIIINVYDLPYADFILPSPSSMCFKGNNFQFLDASTAGKSGAPIASRAWDFGDGGVSTATNPLYSYLQSGAYTIFLQISDTNGCIDTVTKISSIKVLPNIDPKFKTAYKISCPATPVRFNNLSDSNGKWISKWWWDFGDGTGDSSSSNWDAQFTHTYSKDGAFNPKLVVQSHYACTDSFIFPAGARNIFYRFDIKKSIPGSICWEGNNVCFSQTPRPNAYYWLWTFDDPISANLNNDDKTWEPCHKYSSTGNFHINLKIWEPNCIRDTTFCGFVAVAGPQAMIKLPAPASNSKCQSGKKIPITVFEAAYSSCLNPLNKPITYALSQKMPKFVIRTDSFYCNAPIVATVPIYKTGCTVPIISKINYQLGAAQGADKYYDSMVWYNNTWYPGDPYPWVYNPTKTAYYPVVGSCNYKNMHDSDQYISDCRGPNLVFFPNNSTKYRLRYDIDNESRNFTIPPGKDKSMDRCANPSYPWASDSLQYFWDFGDPYALNCTSSVSTPNSECKFSTEVTPFHNYKKSGCYVAKLIATDTVTQCVSQSTVSISMETPDAGWDYKLFKSMALAGWDTSAQKLDWNTQLQISPTWGRRGMILNGIPCVGQAYPQKPDFKETKPSCGQQKWWMVFDSASDCSGFCKDSVWADTNGDGTKDKLIKTAKIQCSWIDDAAFVAMGNKYIYSKGGCKTVGLIIKTGDCIDSFWYSKYKYIADLQAGFDILDPSSYNVDSGRYLRTLNYGANQQNNLCAPFQAILTVSDTLQKGIISFNFSISKNYSAPWTKPWKMPLEDSCTKTQSVSYLLCDNSSYYIDPLPPHNVVWTYCFVFPNPGLNCDAGIKTNLTVQDYLSRGFFKKETYKILDLTDTLIMHDSLGNSLFEPGKYVVNSQIRNLYNCYNLAQKELIVGHYTNFEASNQIVCVRAGGNRVSFNGNVKYFQQKQFSWEPDLNPTEFWKNPSAARGGKLPTYPSVAEKIEWDLNGDGIYGDGATGKPDSVSYLYTQTGNYTVSMRTTDSNNCTQVLERKNFIQVIDVVADFDTANGLSVCAPQTVRFLDKSLGVNIFRYFYDVFGNPISKIAIDSVVSWQWDFGDNLPGNLSKSTLKSPLHTYIKNGCYSVSLIVKMISGCTDTITKINYICIQGPSPKFIVLDSVGYAPFTVFVKDKSSNTSLWEFVKGDASTATFTKRPADSIFTFVYNTPGSFYLSLRASDSFFNNAIGKWVGCTEEYAETSDQNDPHFIISVGYNSIIEEAKIKEFYVYPNPFAESVNVFIPNNKVITEIELLDLSGKRIQFRNNIKANNMEIFRDELPQGIYILKIVSDKVSVFKLMAE